jgi:hypothetical protein
MFERIFLGIIAIILLGLAFIGTREVYKDAVFTRNYDMYMSEIKKVIFNIHINKVCSDIKIRFWYSKAFVSDELLYKEKINSFELFKNEIDNYISLIVRSNSDIIKLMSKDERLYDRIDAMIGAILSDSAYYDLIVEYYKSNN